MSLTKVTAPLLASTTGSGTTVVLSTSPTITTPTISGSLTTSSSGVTFSDGSTQTAAASPFGLKNRIINGDMVIDQRNNGAAVTINTGANNYTVDRWSASASGGGVFSAQRTTTVPSGFINSYGLTVTTIDSSIGSTDYYNFQQFIEGFNVADLGWGTASAQTITVSFWVRSSVTGTFAGSVCNSALNRSYVFTYTISAANTFEYKTVTIPGDTSGTWLTNNGRGIILGFDLGNGSSYQAAAGSWVSSYAIGTSSSVKLISTLNATFFITGVQLERNTTATPFEWIPYTTELQLCQRYCQIISGSSEFSNAFSRYLTTGNGSATTLWMPTFPVQMRTPPSLLTKNFTGSSVDFYNYNTTGTPPFSFVTISEGDVVHAQVTITFTSGSAIGNMISWRWNGNLDAYIGFNAEL